MAADAYIVVYSMVDRSTFAAAEELLDSIQRTTSPSYTPVLLMANKSDLDHLRQVWLHRLFVTFSVTITSNPQVKEEEGRDLAVKFNCCDFQEVSAAEDVDGIHQAIHGLIREAVHVKMRQSAPRQRKLSAFKMIGSLIGRNQPEVPSTKQMPSSLQNERANSFKGVFKKRSV